MDFSLNEEQEMFRGSVRKYLDGGGQTKIAREMAKNNTNLLTKTWKGLAQLGCMGITVKEEYGGAELTTVDQVPVLEELGRALLPGLYLETVAFAAPMIEKFGTTEQKEKYLPGIADGSRTISLAWLEPGKCFNLNDIQMTAKFDGDSMILNGSKTLVPEGNLADTYLVLVRSESETDGKGISFVLVDRNDDGVDYRVLQAMDETRHLTEVNFKNVIVSNSRILGELHRGEDAIEEGLLYLNAALTSIMVGGMDKIVEMCAEYAKIRVQFGQPIGRFQAIKHRIADMKLDLETARSLSYYAVWALDEKAEDAAVAVNSARAFITEAYLRLAGHGIQIHGGIGVTEEIDCHLYLKRAQYYQTYLGNSRLYREKAATALNW
ncbi:acyl-CoA dehydrogenase [Pradoshia sp. D12]|uniref:acyl-CoA dehydrogenase family protein n=1 Tax=Bacillaceae TaxID=186817 RepID=UPI00112B5859|nr:MULTISPECIES: acyl-CoA dehydrogenase family protein [Bacillaceae]QFK71431.1 acyl-CoA dehydrogenase [Pradoshia sp. D12]TPF73226.1 acyl-CoA dehydrogenase [Bacillus sp. D12]